MTNEPRDEDAPNGEAPEPAAEARKPNADARESTADASPEPAPAELASAEPRTAGPAGPEPRTAERHTAGPPESEARTSGPPELERPDPDAPEHEPVLTTQGVPPIGPVGEPRERRPWLERIGLGLIALVIGTLFGAVALAAWSGGEPFLGIMGGVGCLMTFWVGVLTIVRG